jgi:tetratricopeptide (TPR) repeat protein
VDYLLRVDGDALHPFLLEGDHVGVQRRPTEEEVAEGAFVVARIDGGRTVLKKYSLVGNQPQLVSVNPFYAPLKPTQLEVTGIVRWVWRDLGPGEAGTAEQAARTLFEWLQEVDREIGRLERRLERGQGQWTELVELCREVQEAVEKLQPVYGASVVEPAAKGLARLARALYEQGRLRESVEKHEQAAAYFDQIERASPRSSAALLNAHNLAESYLLLGDVGKALDYAEKVSHADDWRVRWLGLKTRAEIRYNFQSSPPDADLALCDELLELARQHEAEDPEEAALLRSGVHEIRVNFFLTHGQPDRALQEAHQEKAESERSGRLDRLLTAQLDQALGAAAVGDGDQAQEFLEAFDHLLRKHDLVEAAKELRAVAEAIRADVATLRGALDEAQKHAHRGLKGALEVGSLRGVMLNEWSYARTCRAAGKEEVARFHADEAAQSAADFHLEPYREMIAAWRSERNGG